MAPHLTNHEQDLIHEWMGDGLDAGDIHGKLEALRKRDGVDCVHVSKIREFMRGRTYRRGIVETRGRKRSWSRANVLNADAARLRKIDKCEGQKYIKWDVIVQGSRAPKVPATTLHSPRSD